MLTHVRIAPDVIKRFRASSIHQGYSDSVALSLLLDKLEEYNRIDARLQAIEQKLDDTNIYIEESVEYAKDINVDWGSVG